MDDNYLILNATYENNIMLAKLLKTGILYQCVYNNKFSDFLSELTNKCKYNNKDNETDFIFKSFILAGNMTNTMIFTKLPNKKISDTLFFKQSSDIEITFLAKIIYFESNTKFKDFLQWQINVILRDKKIDIKHEYIMWHYSITDREPNLHGIEF